MNSNPSRTAAYFEDRAKRARTAEERKRFLAVARRYHKLAKESVRTDVRRGATTLRVGQRVCRITTDERGTVTEANGKVKVRWDGGATSYFRRDRSADVRLAPKP